MGFLEARETTQKYVRLPSPIDFPSEASVPETKRHLEIRTTLYLLLKEVLSSAAVGSEQFVYYDASDPRKCLSPDAFVKLGARDEAFDTWKIWERAAPDLAVEITSASDRRDEDWEAKLARYQASGIGEVVRFDPEDEAHPIRVWDRVSGELLERSPESAELRACTALGLWWVVVPSAYGPMLRLSRDAQGTELLPTADEARLRLAHALAEQGKARAEAEHLRMLAERERNEALAEIERLRAELRTRR